MSTAPSPVAAPADALRPAQPLSPRDTAIAQHLAAGKRPPAIARTLGETLRNVRARIHAMAARLPGDLPAQVRVTVWARGAPSAVLCPRPDVVSDRVTSAAVAHAVCGGSD